MRKIAAGIAAASAAALAAGALAAPAANAADGTKSLAAVLTAEAPKFDKNWNDYDIVTAAVLAVLEAKPKSTVGLLTKGDVALTAFIPNDRAFQTLVKDLTGKKPSSEAADVRRCGRSRWASTWSRRSCSTTSSPARPSTPQRR